MEKKNKAEECQIALIGASQSGKTTLAAGLAKTSDEKFTVGFADKSTRDYLEPIISSIDCGKWPLASNCEDTDLVLSLHMSGGRSSSLSFKEYKGEKIGDKTYVENLVGHPRGALILLNPGMDVFHADKAKDEEEAEARIKGRVKMINDLKNIIDYLREDKTCAAIALVVTASDRLSSDLQSFRTDFENYLLEITNHLKTNGVPWKRFEVTITGKLANQEAPSFKDAAKEKANHQARAPFIWLMKRICAGDVFSKIKKILKIVAWAAVAFAGIACACLGWMFCREQQSMAECEARAKAAVGSYDRAATAKTDNESDMNRSLQNLHEIIQGSATNHFWFSWIDAQRTNFVARALSIHDRMTAGFLNWKINKFRSNPNGEPEDRCRTIDNLISDFKPGEPSLKEDVRKSWESVRPQVREKYDSKMSEDFWRNLREASKEDAAKRVRKEVGEWAPTPQYDSAKTDLLAGTDRKLDELKSIDLKKDIEKEEGIAEHETEKVKSLWQKIDEWTPLTSFGVEKKNALKERFDARSKVWYQEIADRKCRRDADAIVSGLPKMGLDEAAEIRKELEKIQAFSSAHANAQVNVLKSACEQVCRARTSFLTRFSEQRFSSAWKVASKKRPELSKADKDFIVAALDLDDWEQSGQKFSVRFLEGLKKQCDEAGVAWENEQRKISESFVQSLEHKSVKEGLEEYIGTWFRKNMYNPFAVNVDKKMSLLIAAFFDQYLEEVKKDFLESSSAFNSDAGRRKSCERFRDFNDICRKLNNPNNVCGLTNAWFVPFVQECVGNGHVGKANINKAFEQTLTISRIDAKVDGAPFDNYRGVSLNVFMNHYEWNDLTFQSVTHEEVGKGNTSSDDLGVWKSIWTGKMFLRVNPWTYSEMSSKGVLDINWDIDKPFTVQNFRMLPLQESYSSGYVELPKTHLKYVTKGLKELHYDVHIRIFCSFNGPDIFTIYKKHRQGW